MKINLQGMKILKKQNWSSTLNPPQCSPFQFFVWKVLASPPSLFRFQTKLRSTSHYVALWHNFQTSSFSLLNNEKRRGEKKERRKADSWIVRQIEGHRVRDKDIEK